MEIKEMEIKEINNKEVWENFLLDCEEKTFLQSWNWGEFQKMMGHKIWRLGIYSNEQRTMNNEGPRPFSEKGGAYGAGNEQLVGIALVVKIEARRGKFLFLPHAPVIRNQNSKRYNIARSQYSVTEFKKRILEGLLKELKKIAKKENCSFIRIAPVWERTGENEKIFKDLGFRTAPLHTHPEVTWELNLKKPEKELLAAMRKTTRYLIKQGLKNEELEISKSQNIEDIEIFNDLYQKTVDRHHFVPFSLKYLKNEFRAFARDPSAQFTPSKVEGPQGDDEAIVFLAKYREECLASAIVIFWQGIGFYHQGASTPKYPKIPASYLLQWEAIKEAKRRGCKLYNFWGIADISLKFKVQSSKFEKHPFWGLTLFKKGFGGYEKKYVKTQDLPLSLKYWFTFVFENLRKKKRGF